jgi:hypothetical protein
VIHVVTVITANGEQQMTTMTTEEDGKAQATVNAEPPKPTKKASVGARSRHVASTKGKSGKKASAAKKTAKSVKVAAAKKSPKAAKKAGARDGSKTAKVLDLLKRPGGVTSKELMKATGWQPHSVRGFLSGTVGKKMGLTVISTKGEDGERTYSVKA